MGNRDDYVRGLAEAFSRRYVTVCHCGGVGYVRTNAPPGHPLFGKAIPCVCQREDLARDRAERLRRMSGMSEVQLGDWTFETFNPALCRGERERMADIKRQCQDYAAHPSGWLILSGPTGTGKTHLAYAIASSCLARDESVYAAPVPDLLGMLRRTFDEGNYDQVFGQVCNVGVLILDDLGAQHETGWTLEVLYQIVNRRYMNRQPMVVTTNAPLDGLDVRIGSRLAEGSKAQHGWSRILTLPCGDFRPRRRMV